MKGQVALFLVSLALLTNGCQKAEVKMTPTPEDRFEILVRHLLRRLSESHTENSRLQTEIVKHDNKCLAEQIAILEGRYHPPSLAQKLNEAKESAAAPGNSLNSGLSITAQDLLDSEDYIEEHNRKHPEHLYANEKDLLRTMCGDCKRERAERNAQLSEENGQYKPQTPER